jgi:hypothetical protein
MRYAPSFTFLLLIVVGCSTAASRKDPGDFLAHRVPIPRDYTWGKSNIHSNSRIELYLHAYEESWWSCVTKYAANIDYRSTINDRMGSGFDATISGAYDGYTAAESRIHSLVARFGANEAQQILRSALECPNPDR